MSDTEPQPTNEPLITKSTLDRLDALKSHYLIKVREAQLRLDELKEKLRRLDEFDQEAEKEWP